MFNNVETNQAIISCTFPVDLDSIDKLKFKALSIEWEGCYQ